MAIDCKGYYRFYVDVIGAVFVLRGLDGYLMNRDRVVLEIEDGRVVRVGAPQYVPFYFQNNKTSGAFEKWLIDRAIDTHRLHSRLLRQALGLSAKTEPELVLAANAAVITDSYWFKPIRSRLTYADVQFSSDYFADLALRGNVHYLNNDQFGRFKPNTPELTNIGSFEKCWKIEDGRWWLYKSGNDASRFCELFLHGIGKELGCDMAIYQQVGKSFVRSLDFTDSAVLNFEPMVGLVGRGRNDFSLNYKVLQGFGQELADDYVKMLYLDALCANYDRHEQNYGVLRDPESGNVMKLAPVFDNNIAFMYPEAPDSSVRENDYMIRNFISFIKKEHIQFVPTELSGSALRAIANHIDLNIDKAFAADYILSSQDVLLSELEKIKTHSLSDLICSAEQNKAQIVNGSKQQELEL